MAGETFNTRASQCLWHGCCSNGFPDFKDSNNHCYSYMGDRRNRQRNIYIIIAVVVVLLLCCCCLFLVLAYFYGDQIIGSFSALPSLARLLL